MVFLHEPNVILCSEVCRGPKMSKLQCPVYLPPPGSLLMAWSSEISSNCPNLSIALSSDLKFPADRSLLLHHTSNHILQLTLLIQMTQAVDENDASCERLY